MDPFRTRSSSDALFPSTPTHRVRSGRQNARQMPRTYARGTVPSFISAHHSCPKLIQRIQFRYLSVDELIPGATLGYTLRTVTITPSPYLSYLFSCFFANNGTAVRGSLQHIDQVLEEGITPFLHVPVGANHNTSTVPRTIDALFVCTGLGSRFLGGVEDKHVYAVRGQTILLRAPWVRSGRAFDEQDGTCTYVMPRKNGDVGLPVAAREVDH